MGHDQNLILIVVDDLGAVDLGCYGSSFYETPHLDRLAAQGMRFTDASSSSPVCSPTRASLLTGRSPARVGITQYIGGTAEGRLADVPYLHHLPLGLATLPQALREAGYATWHVGKWHLGDAGSMPTDRGFERNVAGLGWGMPHRGYFSPYGMATLSDGPAGEYLTDRLTDEAIALIRARDHRPFFLNLWHYAVHTPIQAPGDLVEKYRRKARVLGLDRDPPLVEGERFPCLHKRGQRVTRRVVQSDPAYAAMIENLDANIGRLLAELDASGLAERTLVLVTSDNGGLATAEGSPTCNLPWHEGKGWVYEGGTRVCQLVRWPGRTAPGSLCPVPVCSMDVMPTFLEAAGLPQRPEDHCDGVSLVPLLHGGDRLGREALFWHYPHYSNQGGSPACAMRAGRWKLIEFFADDRLELYRLDEDPGEERNLAARHPAVARELHDRLVAWRRGLEARIPVPNPRWAGLMAAAPGGDPAWM
jgi:arylsulfatase A-like enzyme